MTTTLDTGVNLWQRVIDSHHQYLNAFNEFATTARDKIDVLRIALRGKDRSLALQLVTTLTVDEKMALLPEWVNLSRGVHSPFNVAWTVLQSLPHDWVVQHIEKEVDAILRNEEWDDYWMFLQLYGKLDPNLAEKLARRAANHADPEVRELGEEFLAGLPA